MVPLTEIELQVMSRLASGPDGQILIEALKKRLADRDAQLRKLDGPDLHRAQGRAVEIAELLDDLTGARKKLEQPRHRTGPLRQV